MNISDLRIALAVHCVVISMVLTATAFILKNKANFHLLSVGFWWWIGSTLFFLMNPLGSLLTNELSLYSARLGRAGGVPQLYWVLLVICAGMGAYLLTYTASAPIKRPVPLDIRPNKVVIGTLFGLFLLALYQTVKYRTDIGGIPDVEIEHGKFVGSINGWQYTLNRFALFPITYFLMYRRTRVLGIAALIVLTAVRMYDYGDRLTMMSPFLAGMFLYLYRQKRKWPPVWMACIVVIFTFFLVYRGHKTLNEKNEYSSQEMLESVGGAFTGNDTEMLSQLYLVTAVYDENGYTYATPLIETVLFGWIPRNIAPWKDSIFDGMVFKPSNAPFVKMLLGPKSSIIGNLYSYGSLPAVMIGMATCGFVSRRVDGLLADFQPVAVRALGFTYLSFVWMIVGSDLEWSVMYLGVIVCPLLIALACDRTLLGRSYYRSAERSRTGKLSGPRYV